MCVANSYNILTTEYYISHAKSQLVNCGYPSENHPSSTSNFATLEIHNIC